MRLESGEHQPSRGDASGDTQPLRPHPHALFGLPDHQDVVQGRLLRAGQQPVFVAGADHHPLMRFRPKSRVPHKVLYQEKLNLVYVIAPFWEGLCEIRQRPVERERRRPHLHDAGEESPTRKHTRGHERSYGCRVPPAAVLVPERGRIAAAVFVPERGRISAAAGS